MNSKQNGTPEWTPEATAALLAELAAPSVSASSQHPLVAGKRLAAGRTAARLESITHELDEAHRKVGELERKIGDVFGEADTTTLQAALRDAEERVRFLELASATALDKDRAAKAELKAAQHAAEISIETDALTNLKEKGIKFDDILYQLEAFLMGELIPALDATRRVSGNGSQSAFLKDAHLAVELYIAKAARHFMPKGRVAAAMLGNRAYSDRLPGGNYATERRTFK